MLEDRLKEAVSLYNQNISSKIIMSGDHRKADYDEVNIMKEYAIEQGVASEDIFMDHAGFSTYESMYRAKEVFEANKIVIVTQKYHLYRALYIAKQLGLQPKTYSAKTHWYLLPTFYLREICAIIFQCIL